MLRISTWNPNQDMIFIDNHSYSKTSSSFCTNTWEEVSGQLFEQFFEPFPDQSRNDLYVTRESYAGQYVSGLAYKIHQKNARGVDVPCPAGRPCIRRRLDRSVQSAGGPS